MDDSKLKITNCLGNEFSSRIQRRQFSSEKAKCLLHICGMGMLGTMHPFFKPDFEGISQYVNDPSLHVLAFIPTGWAGSTFKSKHKEQTRENITVCVIPYSEHSSFNELKDFVHFIKPGKICSLLSLCLLHFCFCLHESSFYPLPTSNPFYVSNHYFSQSNTDRVQ